MRFCKHSFWAALSACICLAPGPLEAAEAAADAKANDVSAAEKAKMDEEVKFAEALIEANMPDFAAPVIQAAKAKWPDLGPRLEVLELQGDLRLGHFDKVRAALASKPKGSSSYWAISLSMADAYYARGDMANCSKIYREFFAAVPKPKADLKDFYVQSAYKWAQILVMQKSYDEAAKTYDGLLKLDLDEKVWCTVATDCTELLLRLATECGDDPKKAKQKAAYLDRATAYVNQLLWKNELIIVFGRAISMKAHIELLRGKLAKAQSLVEGYMPQLRTIHDSLVEQDPTGSKGYVRMGPMPECRYLLAKIMWDAVQAEAKKSSANEDMIKDSLFGARGKGGRRNGAGAYNHAINVFVKYPESSWAAAAGEMTETIARFVKARYKKDIQTNITAGQMKKVRQMQFRHAYEKYRDGDYAAAEKAYRDVLAQFPELEESVDGVASLAECYVNLWKAAKTPAEKQEWRVFADAAEGYLAERFSGFRAGIYRTAGDHVLRLAARENDLGNRLGAKNLYDLYFRNYPRHYNAAQMAGALASQAWKNESWAEAARFYGIVANNYTNAVGYVDAVKMVSLSNAKLGNAAEEEAWLRKFAGLAKKPVDRISATLNLAIKQQKRGFELFGAAAATNEAAAAEVRKAGAVNVIKAIKDFNAVAKDVKASFASVPKGDQAKLTRYGEAALFLAGESYQRLQFPVAKVPDFRKAAVKQFEAYLAAYPKGKYAPQALVKIGTIWTAEKNMEESQKAFARLQRDFPDSAEAKNSVPRLAKTLIEMGLQQEGVAQYRQMLSTAGKFTAGQFVAAGDALLEARGWDTALQAYDKAAELAKGMTNGASIVARSMVGRARAHYGAKRWGEAHDLLDKFVSDEKLSKTSLVIDAYEMLVEVAAEEGRQQKDDNLRTTFFNQAVESVKKLRNFRKDPAELDLLDLRSGDVMVRKMEAEEAMGLKDKALETCGLAASKFRLFLMSRAPTAEYPASKMTPAQLKNLERCYATVLPLMVKLGKSQSEAVLEYGNAYLELFPDGKSKTAVVNAMNQAKAE